MSKDVQDQMIDHALANTRLVNLDLKPADRDAAMREAAAYLRAMAAIGDPSPTAANVLRVALTMADHATDRPAHLRAIAEGLSPARVRQTETGITKAFLALTKGRRDVDLRSVAAGLEGRFRLSGDQVMRVADDVEIGCDLDADAFARIGRSGDYAIVPRGTRAPRGCASA